MEASKTGESFGLPAYAMESLNGVFRKHPAIDRVTLYGSRAKGNFRHNSDIDLMITAPEMDWSEFNQMGTEIDDLLLPWKVDLALLNHVENQDLLDHVSRVGVQIFGN
jgi:predicted nucleotidyltransferase